MRANLASRHERNFGLNGESLGRPTHLRSLCPEIMARKGKDSD